MFSPTTTALSLVKAAHTSRRDPHRSRRRRLATSPSVSAHAFLSLSPFLTHGLTTPSSSHRHPPPLLDVDEPKIGPRDPKRWKSPPEIRHSLSVAGNSGIRTRNASVLSTGCDSSGKYTCLKKLVYVSKPVKEISCDSSSFHCVCYYLFVGIPFHIPCMCVLGISVCLEGTCGLH
ncbi:hypothetical protein Sjap_021238 [Stephania japonica]|uniref:Uncharacterized protein n=1 Tax=Stephania japonica TaxID=461633 RepID=A0AAP0ELZ4_9MAGN